MTAGAGHHANWAGARVATLAAVISLNGGNDVAAVKSPPRQQGHPMSDAQLVKRRELEVEMLTDFLARQEIPGIIAKRRERTHSQKAARTFKSSDDFGAMHFPSCCDVDAVSAAKSVEPGSAHANEPLSFIQVIAFLDVSQRLGVDVREGEWELGLHPRE